MLTLRNLSANKGKFTLKSLNFTVNEGEIVGLIGRNGSGKTTTLQCLTGQYPLSSGSFTVWGKKLWKMTPEELERIALLDATAQTFKVNARKKKLIKFFTREFYRFDPERFNEYMERLGLDAEKSPAGYSLGQYELFLFAVALSRGARLLLVDETLAGLDPLCKEELFGALRAFTETGGSMLITSHNLSDLDKICDRLIFIEEGEIILETTPDELKETYAVIDVSADVLETVPQEAILYTEKENLSYSLLVKRELVNPAYLNRPVALEDIVTKLLKREKERNGL